MISDLPDAVCDNNNDFLKFKKKKPNKLEDIVDLINYVHIKLDKLNI